VRPAAELDIAPGLRNVLDEAVRRIVGIARPQAIVLFGSHAEGRGHRQSDVDLMVIADRSDTREVTGALYEAMADLAYGRWGDVPPFDILVMTPEEWRHEAELPGLLCFGIRRRGVILHGEAA